MRQKLGLCCSLIHDPDLLILDEPTTGVDPMAAELMPAQHRRTYGAIYEMALAISFTVVPFLAYLLADNPTPFACWHCRAG